MESLKQLKDNWIFLTFLVTSILWYSTVNSRLAQAEQDIKDLRVITQEVQQLNIQVAQINTKIDFIKEKVK